MKHVPAVLLILSAGLAASPARAHHSNAQFDMDRTISIEGVVAEYTWANPHVYITIVETMDAGDETAWEVEGPPPAFLRRQGWSRDMLALGQSVVVVGSPSRDQTVHSLVMSSLERAEVSLFDQASGMGALMNPGEVSAVAAAGLDGVWTTVLSPSVIPLIAETNQLGLTEAGAAALARFDERSMNPGVDCIAHPAPLMMTAPDVKRIVTGDDVIRIAGEFDDAERIVFLNVDSHASARPSVQGYSIGRWQGDTLIIETARFAEHGQGNFLVPASSEKRLVERLTLDEGGRTLTYQFELADPVILSQPLSGEVRWVFSPDLAFEPAPCELSNARRFLDRRP